MNQLYKNMNLIKNIRRFFVIAYANRIYNRNVKKADELWNKYHTRFYVTLAPNSNKLIVFSRKGFKRIKRCIYKSMYRESILHVKDGAFYHTPDVLGNGKLSDVEKEARRIAFIDYAIYRSEIKR